MGFFENLYAESDQLHVVVPRLDNQEGESTNRQQQPHKPIVFSRAHILDVVGFVGSSLSPTLSRQSRCEATTSLELANISYDRSLIRLMMGAVLFVLPDAALWVYII